MSIITQNVDNLHRRAGSKHITELHGRADLLTCMSCGARRDRNEFNSELETINSEWLADALNRLDETEQRPDGDAALKQDNFDHLHVPACISCGEGFLKPHVVFFGDTVPRHRVDRCVAAVDAADGILVGELFFIDPVLSYTDLFYSSSTLLSVSLKFPRAVSCLC